MTLREQLIVERIPAVNLLKETIEKLTKRLETYVAQPNSRQFYIDQQNELLFHLHGVYKTISSFKYLPIWQDVERIMEQTEHADPEIGGHAIFIRTRSTGNIPSVIEKYWIQ